MLTDIEIAQSCVMQPIEKIADTLGLTPDLLEPYGRYKAKVDYLALKDRPQKGRLVLVTAITIATGEILYGALACLVFCAVLYLPQRKMTPGQFLDKVRSGFQDMIGVLFIVTSAFILRDINNLLGMPDYVIGAAKASIAPWLLPATVFLLVTALAVAAGNFWGICAISFPVIIPIAQAIGADVGLTAAAIISATAAGSHLCFFGAEATLACSAAQIEAVNYARTSLPLLVLPVVGTTVLYLVSGWMI